MNKLIRIFFTGLMISFLGSLPLGTLNVAAMQIAVSEGIKNAVLFSLGSLTAEMVYVRLSLVAMDWVRKQEKLFRTLEYVTLAIIFGLAISSFYNALNPSIKKNMILNSTLPKFWLGLLMSAVNPVQIPFWFGWSTVLFTKKILLPFPAQYNFYIIGIGLGTLLGNAVFIFGGKLIANSIHNHQDILSWIIGFIFTITGIVQLIKMVKKRDAVYQVRHHEKMKEIKEKQLKPFQGPDTPNNQ